MPRQMSASGLISRLLPFTLISLWAVLLIAASPNQKNTEKRNVSQTIEGKIASVKKKGRTTLLSVQDAEGNLTEHRLTAKTPVSVSGSGDSGFLIPGAVVYTEAYEKIVKNKQHANQINRFLRNKNQQSLFYGKSFKVYLQGSPKPGWNKKSKEIREIIGQVLKKTDKELTLNMGRAGRAIVKLEAGYKVEIISNDPELISTGANVILHGKPSRGRFKASAVEIELKEPLDSKKYFASKKGSKKRGRKRVAAKNRDRSRNKGSRLSKDENQDKKKTAADSKKYPKSGIDKK